MMFFFNDTATTEIYTLSLHDALPISSVRQSRDGSTSASASAPSASHVSSMKPPGAFPLKWSVSIDRKSTRLNSSHANISYAVFCLKKKEELTILHPLPFKIPIGSVSS